MIETRNFLIEVGTEELPPKSLKNLMDTFQSKVQASLDELHIDHGVVQAFATPRRLALLIENLAKKQANHDVERKGPAVSAAFDKEGKPTSAAEGFARSCGVKVEDLKRIETAQGEWLVHRYEEVGLPIAALIPQIITKALTTLPVAKLMRWGRPDVAFVRPIHWIVIMFGKDVIPANIFGITASNITYGHRFHHPEAITLPSADNYEKILLSQGFVIPSFNARREKILEQVMAIISKVGKVVIPNILLDEVTAIVEWPVALLAQFDKKYLEIPSEVLMTSMQYHQRCFAVTNEQGNLLPYFVTVSNIDSRDPKRVIVGNERVMRARLSDAEFFYQTDCKKPLVDRLEGLKNLIFQTKLGSVYDKAVRISRLAGEIAQEINAHTQNAERAGLLAKADLLSEMVGEFPELQGVMGSYYALNDHEHPTVAQAIREHYLPKFAGDSLPKSLEGSAVAIADRLDTLVGIFGINPLPTGDKDPFGLRRAATGILRIIIDNEFNIDLAHWLNRAKELYGSRLANDEVVNWVQHFMFERLRASYLEKGIMPDVLAAVLATNPTQPYDFSKRLRAVTDFLKLPQAKTLARANKRVSNILIKENQLLLTGEVDASLLHEESEKILAQALAEKGRITEPFFKEKRYTNILANLADLQDPVDRFFDKVMVMVEDEKLRRNRLLLLAALRKLFLKVADISLLQDSPSTMLSEEAR